ncbi:MAG: DUF4838 domain-containing protein, partial [Planctomycetes bacterium]|nr:DUF4838 domain-containing protein [Planctomycetota bacterium]
MQFQRFSLALCLWAIITTACPAAATAETPDLNPVTFKKVPSHQPIKIVQDGKPLASICIMTGKNRAMRRVAGEMQKSIEMTTGAKLPILWEKLKTPAIVLGDCPAAKKAGLAGEKMPIEGFAIKTAPDRIHIVGNGDGTSWGAYEFLERYVGVRWYWPDYRDEFGRSGVSVIKTRTLTVPPVNLYDAPAFRKRTRWPSGGPRIGEAVMSAHDHRLRCGNSWPIDLIVHAPHNWARQYKESRPEIFQLRKDGKRDYSMLCYGHPRTLETYLEEIEYQRKKLKAGERLARGRRIIKGKAITVSPADIAVSCRCKYCRKLWNKDGGHYGTASKILGSFVAELGRHVKKQWPDMTVIFLTYKNYTLAPEGVEFPDNCQIQICGMPGLAQYKDKVIRARMQQNVDDWVRLTGNKVQNWHYSCWPANRTKAAYLFPHTV